MISLKTLKAIEYDKIMLDVSNYAVLESTKREICSFVPLTSHSEVKNLLDKTDEAFKYLYTYSTGGIYYFDDVSELLKRVDIGGTLSIGEILKVTANLKSARIVKNAIESVNDDNLFLIKEIVSRLFINQEFENEIADKIVSEDQLSDNASPKLYSIRKSIASINARIRSHIGGLLCG